MRYTFVDGGDGDSDLLQLCERRSSGRPTVLLLELRFKVSGGEKKSHILAETTLFWHLYMTAHLSPILTRTICRRADFFKL